MAIGMENYHNHLRNACKYFSASFLLGVQNYSVPYNSGLSMRPFKEQLEPQKILEEKTDMYKQLPFK